MLEWEKHEKHEKEIREILKANKCMDSKGQIRAWKPKAYQDMVAKGHTSVGFDGCKCRSEKTG